MAEIREARMEDLEALGHIAYATGFFGESARRFFPRESIGRNSRPPCASTG
ncbi:hypothetical protein [Calidithermus timidus]|jgi:hypothetical protein|uniref:hypothetical protein n=1 Tax=Calidithermus timidus TaxID=307124 RepID=UPI0003608C6F|nr:hypothetical protein [Calidithermus timidus]